MTSVHSLASKLLAEFVGTFFLVAAGLGVYAAGAGAPDLLDVAFAHGLAIAIGVTAVGHVSGGHFNPAVSIAMMVFRQQRITDGLAYIATQLVAAYAAAAVIRIGWGEKVTDYAGSVPSLGDGVNVGNGLVLETIATFLLVWTVFAVAVDRDGAFFKVAGLPIGFAVAVGILMTGPATGAAMNPARWFGPALLTGTWSDALVWIVGPLVGAVLAGGAYLYGIRPRLAGVAAAPDTV